MDRRTLLGALLVGGLGAYGCLQLAAFDELGFGHAPATGPAPDADGGEDGGCRSHAECDAGSPCMVGLCRAGACEAGPATPGTDCAAAGGDVCDDAGHCLVTGHRWSHVFGDGQRQQALGVAIDAAGNVLLVGEMQGAVDFGGGERPSHDLHGGDAFVVRLDGDGRHLWSRAYGDDYRQVASSVAADHLNDLVVVGSFSGEIDFGGGPLASAMVSPVRDRDGGAGGASPDAGEPDAAPLPSTDVFVAKLDATGGETYAHGFGDGQEQYADAVAVDAAGNAIVVGHFGGTLDVGSTELTSEDGWDGFVLKLSPLGEPLWAKRLGGPADQRPEAVAVDGSGNAIVVGWFQEAIAIDPADPSATSRGGTDAFVVKLDPAGTVLWLETYGDAPNDAGVGQAQLAYGVAVSELGDIVVVGEVVGSVALPGGGRLTGHGGGDVFLLELAADGSWLAAFRYGDEERQLAQAVALGSSSQIVLTGQFAGELAFREDHPLAGPFPPDAFVARLSAAGLEQRAYRLGDVGEQFGRAVAAADGRVVVAGYFSDEIDLGQGPVAGAGLFDAFVAQYAF